MNQDSELSFASLGSSASVETFYEDLKLSNILRASISNHNKPQTKNCTQEVTRKMECEFENDILKMNFAKIPLRLSEKLSLMQMSDRHLFMLKESIKLLKDRSKNVLENHENWNAFTKIVDDFIQEKSVFNFRLSQQYSTAIWFNFRTDTCVQEFERVKEYYASIYKGDTIDYIGLKTSSNKIANINERLTQLEDDLKTTDELMNMVVLNIDELSMGRTRPLNNLGEYQRALESVTQISARCNNKMEMLEIENNILRSDSFFRSGTSTNSTTTLNKSSSQVSHVEKVKEKEDVLISMTEPVILSSHVYLEALQEKIAEVNELKKALVEVAVAATNENIKKSLNIKISNKRDGSKHKYITEAVKVIKSNIILQKQAESIYNRWFPILILDDENEAKKLLKQEKEKFDQLFNRYKREVIERRYLHNKLEDLKGNVRVYCRVRPTIKGENGQIPLQNEPYISLPDIHTIRVFHQPYKRDIKFEINHVFNPEDDQHTIFDEVNPLICSVMDGYNACIMAYGQTGSGKTHTMIGSDKEPGVIPRAVRRMFSMVKEREQDYEYQICLSILEIYNEQVRDLLAVNPIVATKIDIKEVNNAIHIMPCLMAPEIKNENLAFQIMDKGNSNRTIGSTQMNEYSSRSHLIFMFTVFSVNKLTNKKYSSRLNLVDLAGSERLYKSESEGERMKEALHINQSLTTLGKVLNSLASKNSHTPYRESKLTHLLKESLGGDSKTLLIVQVSPDPREVSETLSTLQFGTRVMKIEKGKAKQNVLQESEIVTNINLSKVTPPTTSQSAHPSPVSTRLINSRSTNTLNFKVESPQQKLPSRESPMLSKNKENGQGNMTQSKVPVHHVHTKSFTKSPPRITFHMSRRQTVDSQAMSATDPSNPKRAVKELMGSPDLVHKVSKVTGPLKQAFPN